MLVKEAVNKLYKSLVVTWIVAKADQSILHIIITAVRHEGIKSKGCDRFFVLQTRKLPDNGRMVQVQQKMFLSSTFILNFGEETQENTAADWRGYESIVQKTR